MSLPATVKIIEEGAFESCKKLTEIKLPPALTKIDKSAFRSCSSLKEVVIPNSVKSIGVTAFKFCKGLKKAYVPKTVTKIGKEAFAKCPDLTIVTTAGSVAEKYAIGDGIPVQIISATELDDIIKGAFVVDDLLSIQLKSAQKIGPAAIVTIGEKRVLIRTAEKSEIPTLNPCEQYVKNREAIEMCVAANAQEGVELAIGYLAFDKDKIQRPTAEELEQLFGDFAKICQACKSEKFMNFIGGLLPQKKNGSLHIGRKTVLAKLPLLIGLLNDADMRLSHSFDLVAKIESETEVSLWVEWVDLVKSVEEDYHSFLRSEAVLPFDEMLKIASQYV